MKKILYSALLPGYLLSCALVFHSCEKSGNQAEQETPDPPVVKEIVIGDGSLGEFSLALGKTLTLTATVKPDDYKNPKVSWTVSPQGVVSLFPDASTLSCVVSGDAEGSATITASCGGLNAKATVTVFKEFEPQGVKASYEDFLGTWYVSGTLGVYFQHWHEMDPCEIRYCVTVDRDEAGTGYLIREWETPSRIADAEVTYYSALHKDNDELYLDDLYSYWGAKSYNPDLMTLQAQYDAEYGYMIVKSQEKYLSSDKSHSYRFTQTIGDIGSHTIASELDAEVGHFWKQEDGSIKVLSPDGSTATVAMGYMDIDPKFQVANLIFNSLPDFPLTMTRAENVVTSVSIDGMTEYSQQIASVEAGEEFDVTATLQPAGADPTHLEWYSETPEVATVDANGHVKTLKAGSSVIFAYADGAWARGVVSVSPALSYTAPSQGVGLNLPSGTLWAPYNVGAAAPEEYGARYSWGETEPKKDYSQRTYKYFEYTSQYSGRYTKYAKRDDNLHLEGSDDAAWCNWNHSWKTPTKEQMEELIQYTTRSLDTVNGIKGVRFTGTNGASIFIPFNGGYFEDELQGAGETAYLWTDTGFVATDYSNCTAYGISIRSSYINFDLDVAPSSRKNGWGVRPVMK